jgi:hypothetical protein
MYDRCIAALRINDREEREQEIADVLDELKALKDQAKAPAVVLRSLIGPTGRGERMGIIVVGLMFPAYQKLQNAADRHEQTQLNLRLAFTLAAFRADHGRYPAKLDELVPKYFERIPDDVFSGKPLIYRLVGAGYLLYSVGQDGKDDDGRSYDDEPRGDDIAVRMPVPEPKIKK